MMLNTGTAPLLGAVDVSTLSLVYPVTVATAKNVAKGSRNSGLDTETSALPEKLKG